MRSWLAAAALAVATSACAAGGGPRVTNAPDAGTPLEARLFPPYYGQVALELTRPAYVALFEVVPGRGVSLLYPQSGSGFVPVRETWVPLRYSPQRWLYGDRYAAMGRYGAGRLDAYDRYDRYGAYGRPDLAGYGGDAPPRYLFVVASEQPLAVDMFQGDGGSLRAYLGPARYASYQPYDVMEQLAYALLPYDDAWVSDVYVDWGYDWGYGYGPGSSIASASYYGVQCGDGRVLPARWISGWGWDGLPCPLANRPGTGFPGSPVVPRPPGGGDSTVVPPPGGGRSRATAPGDTVGRQRAGDEAEAAERRAGESAEQSRSRQRITELRDEARRPGFRDELSTRLRSQVVRRQTADVARGTATRPDGRAGPRSRTAGASRDADDARRRAAGSSAGTPSVRQEPASSGSGSPGSAGSAPRSRAPSSPPPSSGSSGGRSRSGPPA